MPRVKIELPETFVNEYREHQSLKRLSLKYKICVETVKARLRERGVKIITHQRRKGHLQKNGEELKGGVISEETREKMRVNTEINDRYFAKTNIKGKKYNVSHHPLLEI